MQADRPHLSIRVPVSPETRRAKRLKAVKSAMADVGEVQDPLPEMQEMYGDFFMAGIPLFLDLLNV